MEEEQKKPEVIKLLQSYIIDQILGVEQSVKKETFPLSPFLSGKKKSELRPHHLKRMKKRKAPNPAFLSPPLPEREKGEWGSTNTISPTKISLPKKGLREKGEEGFSASNFLRSARKGKGGRRNYKVNDYLPSFRRGRKTQGDQGPNLFSLPQRRRENFHT